MKLVSAAGMFLLLFIGLIVVGCNGCDRIGPGHVGIKVSLAGSDKGVLDSPVRTGYVFYNPFTSTVIEYPTNMQTVVWTKSTKEGNPLDESVTFTNKDQLAINADVSLNYFLSTNKVPEFYVKFLAKNIDDFTNGYLHTIARNCMNDTAGQYSIEQLMGDNKGFLDQTKACIQKTVEPYGVQVDSFGFIGAPRPPDVVLNNINAKIQAEQIALQKQNELLQVQADANKQIAAAEGKAKSMIAEANGEAEANRIRTASISNVILQNKALDNQHDAIWRWNGVMPDTVVSGHEGGLLFNIPTKANNQQ